MQIDDYNMATIQYPEDTAEDMLARISAGYTHRNKNQCVDCQLLNNQQNIKPGSMWLCGKYNFRVIGAGSCPSFKR